MPSHHRRGAHGSLAVPISVLVTLAAIVGAQEQQQRNRGEGFYQCVSANTPGLGDWWVGLQGTGYIWDVNRSGAIVPQGFMTARSEIGLFSMCSATVESQFLNVMRGSHLHFGTVAAGAKVTLPNNQDLRLEGFGLATKFTYSVLHDYNSLAGYRSGGTGFSPVGFLFEGGTAEVKFLYDRDFIAKYSFLPIKLCANVGARIPFQKDLMPSSLYLIDAAIAYVGLTADAFVEFSMEGFFNGSMEPKIFRGLPTYPPRVWEVAMTENPIYLTLGGRQRFDNGLTVTLCVPLLLSSNVGSAMTDADKLELDRGPRFADERLRGITDPFDPWYAKWKIVGDVTFPLHYEQSGAEMRRTFLLMKNVKQKKNIDIDQRLKSLQGGSGRGNVAPADTMRQTDEQRLEEIRKRREQMTKPQ